MAKKQIRSERKMLAKVNIEPCIQRGYLRIPFELLSLKIPQEGGDDRFITLSEVHVLAFLMQFSDGKFTIGKISEILSLSKKTVIKAIKNLTAAKFLDINFEESK